ncbi:hypothetical protein NLJ89_g3180 [Agrocybe chaxingu]|uniref:VHS-domain-containing protein n=1 Tax=Agrocybe chaxingu TaxID=84603 RepID=A0A9W8K5D7_9AGAR|nr:hypothetical protein NLJ89_g3180 [Agrocybe chaxingu]
MLQSPTGPSSWLRTSPLEILITRSCEPSLPEPNYALHLEVAEYINQKKANTPREAAMTIARLANHRNPHIAILALALLDTLVQSCGYPFHLQISTKEFLNEILELIHGWKEGICTESRWKEDLGNIRDMHRLLTFKGYRFRDTGRSTNTAAAATANLKTAEQLEEEDRAAQSAKLQELIRRGTPRDLAAAQELMKSLAGANPDAKPDYRTQALNELNKLEQKVILLNEMLDNVDRERGEKFATGDAYDQVSSILSAARPKLQKWVSDAETDDPESLDTFLQINDQINTVLDRYEAFKKGDYTFAANPIPRELAGSSTDAGQGISLIDFDDTPAPTGGTAAATNDLSGLFAAPIQQPIQQPQQQFGYGMPAGGFGMGVQQPQLQQLQQQQSPPQQPFAPAPMFHNGAGFRPGAGVSPSHPTQAITPPAAIVLPGTPGSQRSTPAPAAQAQKPNYFANGATPVGAGSGMGVGMGQGVPMGAGMGIGMSGIGAAMAIGMTQPYGQQQQPAFGGSPFGSPYGGSPQPAPGLQHQAQGAFMQPQQVQPARPQQSAGTTTAAAPAGQQKDPFADLAGLF